MSEPYIGEIRLVGFNFAPANWALCNGQLLSIAENEALFNLLGTTYGGDGQTTFGLPDLQGRAPIHQGTNSGNTFVMGQMAGTETVTLTTSNLPTHTHPTAAQSAAGTVAIPNGAVWASSSNSDNKYTSTAANTTLSPQAVSIAGGSQPHENVQPVLVINYIISLYGVFPTQG